MHRRVFLLYGRNFTTRPDLMSGLRSKTLAPPLKLRRHAVGFGDFRFGKTGFPDPFPRFNSEFPSKNKTTHRKGGSFSFVDMAGVEPASRVFS